jgi:hypothetical protein
MRGGLWTKERNWRLTPNKQQALLWNKRLALSGGLLTHRLILYVGAA